MSELYDFETTVITGFEILSAKECHDVLGYNPVVKQGRLKFQMQLEKIVEIIQMRSIENIFLLVYSQEALDLNGKEKLDQLLESITNTIDWNYFCHAYGELKLIIAQKCPHYSLYIKPLKDTPDQIQNGVDKPNIKFRVTCNRTGENHNFQSTEAACILGGHINDKLGWKADMTEYDIEVILNIRHGLVQVCLPLTIKCLSDRNISHFGPTTLKSSICHNLLRLAQPTTGDIVCDPLCGGASIPIEGSICWSDCAYICGDSHEKALLRTRLNLEHLEAKLKEPNCPPTPYGPSTFVNVLPLMWDATRLPLRDGTVDIFITDAPFGKRIGTRNMNRSLYPKLLCEMARVCRTSTAAGRAVVLTKDVTAMSLALKRTKDYWKLVRFFHANIGGLKGTIYLLHRTTVLYGLSQNIFNGCLSEGNSTDAHCDNLDS